MGYCKSVVICYLAVAIATAAAQTKGPDCKPDCACAAVYDPVCGSDGETYTNEGCLTCETQCKPELKKQHVGECNKTEVAKPQEEGCKSTCFCAQVWEPVCGTDGTTYSNEACLNCQTECKKDLKLAHKGECTPKVAREISSAESSESVEDETTVAPDARADRPGTCNVSCVCTKNYEPVCGNNGETYSNKGCLYCASKCLPELSVSHDGECEEGKTETSSDSTAAPKRPQRELEGEVKGSGDCDKACVACPKLWSPVCGSDNKTYSNSACLDCQKPCVEGLRAAYEGECTTEPREAEGCACLQFWDPVCGSDGKTYSNDGCLSCTAKAKSDLKVAYVGECNQAPPSISKPEEAEPSESSEGPCACISLWDPVCGSDGETYSNKACLSCDAQKKKDLQFAYAGECKQAEVPAISQPEKAASGDCKPTCACAQFFDPVCGSDGKTYSNEGCLSCATTCKSDLKLSHKGEC